MTKWLGVVASAALVLGGLTASSGVAQPVVAARAATRPAVAYDVRVRRDTWGVPHVLGRTDADAAYGLGYAQAEDDFLTMQDSIMAGRGKLAAWKGAEGINSDALWTIVDVGGVLERGYERDLPANVRHVVEGYAAGVNRYAEQHPEKVAPGLLPVTGRDLAAYSLLRGPSFYGLDDVFAQILTGRLPGMREIGSNAVAVAPSRSADHHTRLLVNAHQPWTGPVTFWEAVVDSGEGWHVAGSFFPASPFLLGGHNAHLGWGPTVNHPDLVDVYRLTLNPANPNQYRLDGRWRDLETRTVQIMVKQADGSQKPVYREFLRSAHGPVLKTSSGAFAVRYPTQGGAKQLHQYYAMNKARTLAEWQAAMAIQALPSINYIYADERGNIGFLHNGLYPVRKEEPGLNWQGILPGDRSDLIWTKVRPFNQSPQLWNPRSGVVFNANNTPFRASEQADDLKPSSFPASMGLQTDMTNRAWRAFETFGTDRSISAEEFERYKYDLAYSENSDERAWVKEILAADSSADPDLAAAQAVLRQWDGRTDLENRGAAIPALIWLQKRQDKSLSAVAALKKVLPLLKATYGRIDPKWGEVNRLRRGKLDLPVDGGPDTFRALYGRPDPDGRLHGVNGDGFFMFVDWDPQGRLTSRSIHQFGSATLDETSPHYADQSPLFVAHKTKPVWFTEAQLKGHVERDYRPGEGGPR